MPLSSFRGIALIAGLLVLALRSAAAQTPMDAAPDSTDSYVAPAGAPPPVAPPLRKGSPLDHLTNDPKWASLPIGYKEGNTSGSEYYIAHRFIDPMEGQGWGWVRKSDDDWGDGKWIALQETLGLAVAPKRKLLPTATDVDWEFKFWGKFAAYKAYDPRTDEQLPVFILQGYEVLGPAQPLRIKVGPPNRIEHRASGATSRPGRPILSDPGVD
jgi:hypothetical protein